jgi:hypothetical protein
MISGEEGTFGGFKLSTTFPTAWNTSESIIDCTTGGNTAAKARFVISAIGNIDSPLKIINITNNTYFALDISCSPGDQVIIDSDNETATKNGSSII